MPQKKYKFLDLSKNRNNFQIESNSQAHLVLDPTICDTNKIVVNDNADLHLFCFYESNFDGNIDFNSQVFLKNNAKVFITQCFFGGQSVKVNFDLIFEEKLSEGNLNVLYFADKKQNFDFKFKAEFLQSNNKGKILIKGIVKDEANVKVDGIIDIAKEAKSTDASLSEHALSLSPKASVRNLPSLKINTNDVKASHSASITRLNQEDVFYLQSRALDKSSAEKILIENFLKSVYMNQEHLEDYFCKIDEMIVEKF